VSKTNTTTSILHLFERQNQSLAELLDSPVYQYFPVSNPKFPNELITFRHLLSHVSSITKKGDPDPVGDYLRDYLLPGGDLYNLRNFLDVPPVQRYDYCNHCLALIGHLVELLFSIELDEYCRNAIYLPLGMKDTSFFLKNLDQSRIADIHIPLPQYDIPEYPAGNLRSTMSEMVITLDISC